MTKIGIVHPGEMGTALARALIAGGHDVAWASAGRSAASHSRAQSAGLTDAGSLKDLGARSDVIISVCPPDSAVKAAEEFARFRGIYVDANAVSPATATSVSGIVRAGGATYVDGGIIGQPPKSSGDTRLYLSGPEAEQIAQLFAGTVVDARVLSEEPTEASALKMSYAAWTKASAALLLAVVAAAHNLGVEDALADEWEISRPHLPALLSKAQLDADHKGWRWAGEMEEIAATFEAVGVSGGFHRVAAEIYSAGRT